MKKLLLITSFILVTITTYSQVITDSIKYRDGKVIIEEVVAVPNATSSQLYGKAKLFFTKAFNSSKSVIQSEDIENHQIIGHGRVVKHEDQGYGGIYFDFTIIIQTKDGKYRYTITDMCIEMTGLAPMNNTAENAVKLKREKGNPKAIEGFFDDSKPIIDLLKAQMCLKEEDNW